MCKARMQKAGKIVNFRQAGSDFLENKNRADPGFTKVLLELYG